MHMRARGLIYHLPSPVESGSGEDDTQRQSDVVKRMARHAQLQGDTGINDVARDEGLLVFAIKKARWGRRGRGGRERGGRWRGEAQKWVGEGGRVRGGYSARTCFRARVQGGGGLA